MNKPLFFLTPAAIAVTAFPSIAAPKAELPLAVYTDAGRPSPYAPSGYMGNTRSLVMVDSKTRPHSGATCLQVTFSARDWAGIVWQSPANDWGDKPGGLN